MASTGGAKEQELREQEAEAFLSSITPSLVAQSGGGGITQTRTPQRSTSAKVAASPGVQNGHSGSQVVAGSVAASLSSNLQLMQAEEMRQKALKRIKATHRSVKDDPVIVSGGTPSPSKPVSPAATTTRGQNYPDLGFQSPQTKIVASASSKPTVVAGIQRPAPPPTIRSTSPIPQPQMNKSPSPQPIRSPSPQANKVSPQAPSSVAPYNASIV